MTASREQSRARYPDTEGYVERDGVRIFYEVYGQGEPTVLLLPTWTIIHSRQWKMQIPYLARHCRVVTFDGRGNGRSDRPTEASAYAETEYAADALAVLDATGTDRAIIVGFSMGAQRGLLLAAEHPERVDGAVFIGPAYQGGGKPLTERLAHPWTEPLDTDEGWAKYNKHYWLRDYQGFLEFFFSKIFVEPHSTKPIEDCVGWGSGDDGGDARPHGGGTRPGPRGDARRGQAGAVPGVGPARDARRGHLVVARERPRRAHRARSSSSSKGPVMRRTCATRSRPTSCCGTSRALRAPSTRWARGRSRRKRALYISSPIGLGHAQRDVAIAAELRKLHPDLEIDWLAQNPVTRVLEAHGERIHPASAHLANESGHIESESAEHDLHCFQAIRRMDEILLANFMVFHDLVRDEQYDLWIGDEAWELDYYLHENPEQKRAPYVWLTDFVGWLPMPDGESGSRSSPRTTTRR